VCGVQPSSKGLGNFLINCCLSRRNRSVHVLPGTFPEVFIISNTFWTFQHPHCRRWWRMKFYLPSFWKRYVSISAKRRSWFCFGSRAEVIQSVQCLTTDWTKMVGSMAETKVFSLASMCRAALRPTQPPIQWVPDVLFRWSKVGRSVTLTTHPHLVPR
jgi:hypothetical protein